MSKPAIEVMMSAEERELRDSLVAKPLAKSLRVWRDFIARRHRERFGDMSMFDLPLTLAEQVRVQALCQVPMHELPLDDQDDRRRYCAIYARQTLACDPWHVDKASRVEAETGSAWNYWRGWVRPNAVPRPELFAAAITVPIDEQGKAVRQPKPSDDAVAHGG